jgi:hypothetical protein
MSDAKRPATDDTEQQPARRQRQRVEDATLEVPVPAPVPEGTGTGADAGAGASASAPAPDCNADNSDADSDSGSVVSDLTLSPEGTGMATATAASSGAGADAGVSAPAFDLNVRARSRSHSDFDSDSDSDSVVSGIDWLPEDPDIKEDMGIVAIEVHQRCAGLVVHLGTLRVAVDTNDSAVCPANAMRALTAAAGRFVPTDDVRPVGPVLAHSQGMYAVAGILKAGMFALRLRQGPVPDCVSLSCRRGVNHPLEVHTALPSPAGDGPDPLARVRRWLGFTVDSVNEMFGYCRLPVPSRLLEVIPDMPDRLYGDPKTVQAVQALGAAARIVTLRAYLDSA